MGYFLFNLATMVVLPIVAILVDLRRKPQPVMEVVGKWFIFFGVGVRLLAAGLTQILNPGFTGELLQAGGAELLIIQELGFTNVLLGAVALVSVYKPGYRLLGTAGAVYMGFAGWLHLSNLSSSTTPREMVALWSDLWIFAIACLYLVYRAVNRYPVRRPT